MLAFDAATANLTINPIQAAEQRTGDTAITFLILSLACTPLHLVYGAPWLMKLSRPLGLYAFLYAAVHVSIFIGIDYGFDFTLLLQELAQKPYIIVGATCLLILSALALTSFDRAKLILRKRWKQLHRLVYLAGLLAVLHFGWASKGNLFSFSGDIFRPLLAGALVLTLLIIRLPPVRRWLIQRR